MQFDDKPKRMPLKDYIILKLAERLEIPKEKVKLVVEEHFRGIAEAFESTNVMSVEISGFGRFYLREKKIADKLLQMQMRKEKLLNGAFDTKGASLDKIDEDILYMTKKLEDARTRKTNSGGVDKHDSEEEGS